MKTQEFPPYVHEFVEATGIFLEAQGHKLEHVEDHEEGQAKLYRVKVDPYDVSVVVHQTSRSLGRERPEFRVRFGVDLPEEISAVLQGREDALNRFATLGGMVTRESAASVGGQCLIHQAEAETTAGFLAAAIVHAMRSMMLGITQALDGEKGGTHDSTSAWGECDFEGVHYDYAHLGMGDLSAHSWTMAILGGRGSLELTAVHDNPYFGGGLLSLLGVAASTLGVPDEPIPVNDLNTWAFLIDEAPVFGGWCKPDAGRYVFCSFAPNNFKGLPDLLDLQIKWAERRIVALPELLRYQMEGATA